MMLRSYIARRDDERLNSDNRDFKKNNAITNKEFSNTKRIVGLLFILTISIILFSNYQSYLTSSSIHAYGFTVDDIECGPMEQFGYHIHTHLDIFVDGKNYTVPALIGITNNCFYWLHTHDQSGIIHIESPVKKDFNLGQFFDLWNKKYVINSDLNYTVTDNMNLTAYVNGTMIKNGTNIRDIVLHPHDEIALIYGKSPNNIPKTFVFPSGL
jgi:hypothetical protein